MTTHEAPVAEQRSHWRLSVKSRVPSHVPATPVHT
jgi:hypothetical protein